MRDFAAELDAIHSAEAQVSYLPGHTGDGYGYGGGVIVTIGPHAIPLGEGANAAELAHEIAARWNAALAAVRGQK